MPGIWLGAAAANFTVESSFASAIALASGNMLEAFLGAWLLRRHIGGAVAFERPEDVFKFVAICALAATVAASAALVPLTFGHALSWEEMRRNWWTWWQGDFAGLIVVTPLILTWSVHSGARWPVQRKLEAAYFALALILVIVLIRTGHAAEFPPFSLMFLTLPFVAWAAFRFGLREASTAIALICAVAIWDMLGRRDAHPDLNEWLLLLLAFNAMVATTGLALAAAVRERGKIADELRESLRSQVDKHAHYDPLTGLANGALFRHQLAGLLTGAIESGRKVAVAMLDIERFKNVNDTFGRHGGDELLKQVAGRLAADKTASHIIARVAGDRFALASQGFESEDAAAAAVSKALARWFDVPYVLRTNELRLSARIGVALFPDDGEHPELLYARAESALKRAKALRERQLFYTRGMSERIAEKLALENRLRRAIEREEFVLHYQPKVDASRSLVAGLEALIRWNCPELGMIPPAHFISLLEETGLILEVGAWALRRASLDHRAWSEQGLKPPRVAVNVSPIQLRRRDFVSVLERTITHRPAPTGIDLEITESVIMDDVEANIEKLTAVRNLGVNIALDDFGTGYSSLAYLAKLPVQSLKIDRSFIATMRGDATSSHMLVSTIISLAHSLGLKVVAEGVETEDQARILRALGCDELQGYLFSRPVPFEQAAELLLAGTRQIPPKQAG